MTSLEAVQEAATIHIYIQDLETKEIAQPITKTHYGLVKKMIKRHISTLKESEDPLDQSQVEQLEKIIDDFATEYGWLDLDAKVALHVYIESYDLANNTKFNPEGKWFANKPDYYNQTLERLIR